MLRARDYARLRDMLRNRHAGDVAALLTALSLEDQVVVFRVLPRKDAAAVFEYLVAGRQGSAAEGHGAGGRGGAAEQHGAGRPHDVPRGAAGDSHASAAGAADARRARGRASRCSGIPRSSVGRLMTPHYVAVREHWTVREVLDYVRAHGQDSETLNVIYVVDEQGLLIDDIRIREFLLAPLDTKRRGPDGPPVRRAEGDRRSGGRRRRVPSVRPHGAARDRHRRHADRHRHHRRRAGRGGSDGDERDPANRRIGSARRAVHGHRASGG